MWKILLVEDQAIVRQGLKVILEQDNNLQVTHEAENGEEAIDIVEKHLIDLVLMDIRMPVMNGINATRIMKRKWPHVKILILTTFNDEQYAMETLRDGANGFLLKTAESDRLIEAVYSCMKGAMPLHDEVVAKVMPHLLEQKKTKQELPVTLTERELKVIQLVGEGLTNKEIAAGLFLSVGTVKNQITQILQKTNLRDRTQLALFAVKHGLT